MPFNVTIISKLCYSGSIFQARYSLELRQKSIRNEECRLVQEPNQHLACRRSRLIGTRDCKRLEEELEIKSGIAKEEQHNKI